MLSAIVTSKAATLNVIRRPERITGQIVSGNYFTVVGVRSALGRFFLPEEDRTAGTHPFVVIIHGVWRRRFAADPEILGRSSSPGQLAAIARTTAMHFKGRCRSRATGASIRSAATRASMPCCAR